MRVLLIFMLLIGSAALLQAQDGSKKKSALKEQAEKFEKDEDSGGNADMVRIKASEVPTLLKKTLQSAEYAGWDSPASAIYGSEQDDLFVVEIHAKNQSKTFYFDGDGKPIRY